jgi:hypothetical protein
MKTAIIASLVAGATAFAPAVNKVCDCVLKTLEYPERSNCPVNYALPSSFSSELKKKVDLVDNFTTVVIVDSFYAH